MKTAAPTGSGSFKRYFKGDRLMMANKVCVRDDARKYPRLANWWRDLAEWFDVSFYGLIVIAFVIFVAMPILSSSETKLRNGAQIMTYEEIARGVDALSLMIKDAEKDDALDGKVYWSILNKQAELERHCSAFQIKSGGYGMVRNDSPCSRLQAGDVAFLFRNYTMQYQDKVSQEKFDAARYAYHGVDDAVSLQLNNLGKGDHSLTETVWHPEKLWDAYRNGMVLAIFLFVFRLKKNRFNIVWEIAFGRLAIMIVLWPGTFWFYPHDPLEQAKEIKRWMGYIITTTLSFFLGSVKLAGAEEKWSVIAGASAQSAYILNNGKVSNPEWVLQPWAEATTTVGSFDGKAVSAYAGVWSSVGLENEKGNEIDFTGGLRTAIDDVSLDVSYNYYRFLGSYDGMHVPKLTVCHKEWGLCGQFQYMIPDIPADAGMQFGAWWSHVWDWYKIGTSIGVMHTRDVYGSQPVTVLKLEASVPVPSCDGVCPEVFARGYIPLGEADKEPVFLTGVRMAF